MSMNIFASQGSALRPRFLWDELLLRVGLRRPPLRIHRQKADVEGPMPVSCLSPTSRCDPSQSVATLEARIQLEVENRVGVEQTHHLRSAVIGLVPRPICHRGHAPPWHLCHGLKAGHQTIYAGRQPAGDPPSCRSAGHQLSCLCTQSRSAPALLV